MILLILVLMAIQRNSVALECFQCVSKHKDTCQSKQRRVKCGGDELKGEWEESRGAHACYTLFYSTVKDNRETSRYIKGCRRGASQVECENYCSSSSISRDVKKCQVSCCSTDGCNKSSFNEKKESAITEKRKRSSQHNNTNSTSRETFGIATILSFSILTLYLTRLLTCI